jgi:hypothetical protein
MGLSTMLDSPFFIQEYYKHFFKKQLQGVV